MKGTDARVTIRLIPEKAYVYEDFQKVVKDRLHSDVCYVTTMLMESFTNAVNETPNLESPVMLNFVRQNVQINMGCDFNYYTKKARRAPPDFTGVTTDTHNLIPEVVTQYPDLSDKAKKFWFDEFKKQGIIPTNLRMDGTLGDPFVSTGKRKRHKRNIFLILLHRIVRHLSRHGKR